MSVERKPPRFKPRQPAIAASALNYILTRVLRRITGGRGISVSYFGDRVVISQKDVNRRSVGSGSSAQTTNWNYTVREY